MDLESILPELLFHICLFLSEVDIVSVSHTCSRLHRILNVDEVWKRFVTEEVKRLKTLTQFLQPPFHPDPHFCENRQHLQRRNKLISNWRNGNCIKLWNKIDKKYRVDRYCSFNIEYYKENYLVARFDESFYSRDHVFYNVSGIPEVQAEKKFDEFLLLIGDSLVDTRTCRVEVYQINIEDNSFPLRYSFLVPEDEVFDHLVSHERNQHDCCFNWACSRSGNYLVFSEKLSMPANSVIHVWDIDNARKVGVFVLPIVCRYAKVHSTINGATTLVLETQGRRRKNAYIKFDVAKNRFSDNAFKAAIGKHGCVSFYKDYCIVLKKYGIKDEQSVVLHTFEYETSKQLKERTFLRTHFELQRRQDRGSWDEMPKVTMPVIDGKLVLLSEDCFHVIDAVSLDILSIIPHEPDILSIIGETCVFGLNVLVTVAEDGSVKIWDLGKDRAISCRDEDSGWKTEECCRKCCLFPQIGPRTNYALVEENQITITHFW